MVVNCSILEFSHKIRRLEMLNAVARYSFNKYPLIFPRTRLLNASNEKQTIEYDVINQLVSKDILASVESVKIVLEEAKKSSVQRLP